MQITRDKYLFVLFVINVTMSTTMSATTTTTTTTPMSMPTPTPIPRIMIIMNLFEVNQTKIAKAN